jgi:LysM repeat protein
LAKKFHVSVKALEDANPGVEATKLKIGQTIHVPAPVVAAAGSGQVSGAADTTAGIQTYVVKSGDSLSKIASEFAVSVKALRSANNLTTDKIVVGQKLKVPAKASATGGATDTTSTAATTSSPATAPSGK